MELKEALLKRRSVRKFTDEAVSDEDINELMHAAMSGPSACNCRPWEFYVVKNADTLKLLKGASHYSGIEAPLAIVVAGNLSRALPLQLSPFWIQDCSAATENILLRATDLGLGAVWCGIHPQKRAEKKVSEALRLSAKQIPLNIIYVGHPAEFPEMRDQYKEEYVHVIE
ncbi:MAG: nitroreductase family protein [Eubacteriales bacterium]|nr:nitroreductase family protein [Eubacteriales bacterium]